jgi:hypothetical protein
MRALDMQFFECSWVVLSLRGTVQCYVIAGVRQLLLVCSLQHWDMLHLLLLLLLLQGLPANSSPWWHVGKLDSIFYLTLIHLQCAAAAAAAGATC